MKLPNPSMPWLILIGACAISMFADLATAAPRERAMRITNAQWNVSGSLVVQGDRAGGYSDITVSNADTSATLGGTTADRRGRWSYSQGFASTSQVPCRVRASDGSTSDEAAVSGAPADCDDGSPPPPSNQPPSADANGPYSGATGASVSFSSAGSNDSDGSIVAYSWNFGDGGSSSSPSPNHSYASANTYTVTLTVTDNDGDSDSDSTSATITDPAPPPPPPPPTDEVSINSTSVTDIPPGTVTEQPFTGDSGYRVFAINDLGMHCGDLDTRISSILPPFNVLHAQVIQRGGTPNKLTPADGVEVVYSAASNPLDPILSGFTSTGQPVVSSRNPVTGEVFKTNFWDIALQAYAPFYPAGILPVFFPPGTEDLGLPMPDTERLYLGDGVLAADQQAMPGIIGPYVDNEPKAFQQYVNDMPFFTSPAFLFGYVSEGVNWFEAAGIPMTAFDDRGRENPWPLYRVQAKAGETVLASLDTVVPISGEANCGICHNAAEDGGEHPDGINRLGSNAATAFDDDPLYGEVPLVVSREYAADLNILRVHDLKHETSLESSLDPVTGRATDPVVCQRCHYTPALDLAQVGPNNVNGRDQLNHKSMSNVMHGFHFSTGLFGTTNAMPPAVDSGGLVRGGTENPEVQAVLESTCYQCHPGRRTDCLRGAMSKGGLVCQDCHGNMAQVGNDFSRDVSPSNPGAFVLAGDFYTNPDTPRVPWANVPSCGSCHTGDANDNLHGDPGTVGSPDGIRLMQAYRTDNPKAAAIVPTNKRFAENVIEADNPAVSDSGDPRIGNPMLYRVSKGHGGMFCEACHGATHGEWPNKNEDANDNLPAKQLQGHTGAIIECSTCHVTSGLSANTQGGPHGMHLVNDSRFWREAHKDAAKAQNGRTGGGTCGACHGSDHLGTVLSRAPVDRHWSVESTTRTVLAGDPVPCNLCHSLSKSFAR